jgi:tetratricopeptide (TPR) repeat protein
VFYVRILFLLISVGLAILHILFIEFGIVPFLVAAAVAAGLFAWPYVEKLWEARHQPRREGKTCLSMGKLREAEELLGRAYQIAQSAPLASVTEKVDVLMHLAETQRRRKKLEDAERSAQTAIHLLQQKRQDGLPAYRQALDLLAEIHRDGQNYAAQEQVLRDVIRREQQAPKPDLQAVARRHLELGLSLQGAGHRDDARAVLEQTMALYEQAFGPEHPEMGTLLTKLGQTYLETGRPAEARPLLERGIAIRDRATKGAPEIAQSLYHLVMACQQTGDLDRATELAERMLELEERRIGGNSREVAHVLLSLAETYLERGWYSKAEERTRRAQMLMGRDADPALVAGAWELLGVIYQRAGRPQEAEPFLERARAARA